jgi:hypothetical protein
MNFWSSFLIIKFISYHPHELLELIPVLPGLPGEILRDVDVGGLQQLRLKSTKLMSERKSLFEAEFPSKFRQDSNVLRLK